MKGPLYSPLKMGQWQEEDVFNADITTHFFKLLGFFFTNLNIGRKTRQQHFADPLIF